MAANAEEAAKALRLDYEVVKVTDVNEIIDSGIMRTPTLAMNEEIAVEGKVATSDGIKKLLAGTRLQET